MKKPITLCLALFALSSAARAESYHGLFDLQWKGPNGLNVEISGDAAKALYQALELPAVPQFGFVQKSIKVSPDRSMVCEQSSVGDIPGDHMEPHYLCLLSVQTR